MHEALKTFWMICAISAGVLMNGLIFLFLYAAWLALRGAAYASADRIAAERVDAEEIAGKIARDMRSRAESGIPMHIDRDRI